MNQEYVKSPWLSPFISLFWDSLGWINCDFPFQKKMTRSFIKKLIPLPERVEEENPNKEDDYQYPRKDRFHLMEDWNEFGWKQWPKSLEAKRKRLNISHNYFDEIDNDWLISEIEEEL